jgi:hypothetical protein
MFVPRINRVIKGHCEAFLGDGTTLNDLTPFIQRVVADAARTVFALFWFWFRFWFWLLFGFGFEFCLFVFCCCCCFFFFVLVFCQI